MQKFFGIPRDTNPGVVTLPDWRYVRDGLQRNLQLVQEYYRRFASRIDGSHFLLKLIYSAGVSRNTPIERYYDYLMARFSGVAMANKMTSPVSTGALFDGVFYGQNVKEVLLACDDDFNPFEAEQNWQSLVPIRVLTHPVTSLRMRVPDGTVNTTDEGVAVIAINIPMLLIQYREYRKAEEARSLETGESPRSDPMFIYNYPLANMMASHLDCAIFNRLYNRLMNIPDGTPITKHSFFMPDYEIFLDRVQEKQIELLRNSTVHRFDGLMKQIPLVTETDLSTFAHLPDVAPTRQVAWGLVLSRMQLLSFLFNATGQDPRIANGMEVNRIRRTLQLYQTDKALRSSLPVDLYFDHKATLQLALSTAPVKAAATA